MSLEQAVTAAAINQVVPPEAPVSGVPAAPVDAAKTEEALSPRFAALAKQTKLLRQQQEALKGEEAALKLKMSEYETKYVSKDRLASDPINVLLENGYSIEQIAQILLNQAQPKDPNISRMEAKMLELEKKAEEPLKKFEEIEKKQYEQAVSQIRTEAKTLVDTDPAYETIKEMGAHEAVVKLITETYDKLGELITVEQAAAKVEEELFNRALKMSSLAKVKAKLTPVQEAAAQTPTTMKPPGGITTQLKTLTNAQVASPSKPKSALERIERAKLAFQGRLNT